MARLFLILFSCWLVCEGRVAVDELRRREEEEGLEEEEKLMHESVDEGHQIAQYSHH